MKNLFTSNENFERIDRYINYLMKIKEEFYERYIAGEELENILTAAIKNLFLHISFINTIVGKNYLEYKEEELIRILYDRWELLMLEDTEIHKIFLTGDKEKNLIQYEGYYEGVSLINKLIVKMKSIEVDFFSKCFSFETNEVVWEEFENIKKSISLIQEILDYENRKMQKNFDSIDKDLI